MNNATTTRRRTSTDRRRTAFFAAIACCVFASGTIERQAIAQIVPDATLPDRSTVTVEGNTIQITGGTARSRNLFHSFESFSIPTGTTATFDNPLTIENIFSRVTGTDLSNIDGLLQANGGANLFLINPNGIVFGPNASLNVGGSFVATSADAVLFDDGSRFSAIAPQTDTLLTVSVPVGLQLGDNPGAIAVNGIGLGRGFATTDFDGSETATQNVETARQEIAFQLSILAREDGLGVRPDRTLALVGGPIVLDGALLKAPQGRIELWSGRNGQLRTTGEPGEFGFEETSPFSSFQDISVTNESGLFTGLGGDGGVRVHGRNLTITGGSEIRSDSLGEEDGGEIALEASEVVEISGVSRDSTSRTIVGSGAFGNGDAGSVEVRATQLNVLDGGWITVGTVSDGEAGTIAIATSESVELSGIPVNGQFASILDASTVGVGNASNVDISTRRLTMGDGAQVRVRTFGPGRGGNLTIRASESVQLSGTDPQSGTSTQIEATAYSSGDAGEIEIVTPLLSLSDGAQIEAASNGTGKGGRLEIEGAELVDIAGVSADGERSLLTTKGFGSGDAGDVTVRTRRLIVRDGGEIGTSTSVDGVGGLMLLEASEAIEFRGTSPDGNLPTLITADTDGAGNAGNVTIATPRLSVGDGAIVVLGSSGEGNAGRLRLDATESVEIVGNAQIDARTLGSGNGGGIAIATDRLQVADGSRIGVNGEGTGSPGNIEIAASDVELDRGALQASSAIGKGGNIDLRSPDILLRNGSEIVAAGSQTGNVTQEGNITIAAETLVLLEASQIVTSATDPQGGSNIAIGAIRGDELLVLLSPDSIINARGQLNIDGDIDIEPANLPEVEVADPDAAIARSPCNPEQLAESTFAIRGRGGLPVNPGQPLSRDRVSVELVEPVWETRGEPSATDSSRDRPSDPLIEARGFDRTADGQILLTAARSSGASSPPHIIELCPQK